MALESEKPSTKRYRYSDEPAASAASVSMPVQLLPDDDWRWVGMSLVGVAAVMGLLFSTCLEHLLERWTHDAGWSHGFVVPLISLFFIRNKWDVLRTLKPQGSMAGLGVMLVAVIGQVLFRATGLEHMSLVAMPVLVFGLVLFVFGWEYLKILWLPIGFLVFALPPPQSLYVQMTTPMQMVAAKLGANLLPLFGGEGVQHGTTIDVIFGGVTKQLFIAQACSGMRLLVAFFALAVALGYSTGRPMWQKVVLAACALPIAILCNGLRVTGTGLLVAKVSDDWGRGDAHGFFGLAMLLPAMLLQLAVAWVLDRIFIETPEPEKAGGAA